MRNAEFGMRNIELIKTRMQSSKLKAPAYAEAPAGRQSSKRTVTPDWLIMGAAERKIGDDIYPVRSVAPLLCSKLTFKNNSAGSNAPLPRSVSSRNDWNF